MGMRVLPKKDSLNTFQDVLKTNYGPKEDVVQSNLNQKQLDTAKSSLEKQQNVFDQAKNKTSSAIAGANEAKTAAVNNVKNVAPVYKPVKYDTSGMNQTDSDAHYANEQAKVGAQPDQVKFDNQKTQILNNFSTSLSSLQAGLVPTNKALQQSANMVQLSRAPTNLLDAAAGFDDAQLQNQQNQQVESNLAARRGALDSLSRSTAGEYQAGKEQVDKIGSGIEQAVDEKTLEVKNKAQKDRTKAQTELRREKALADQLRADRLLQDQAQTPLAFNDEKLDRDIAAAVGIDPEQYVQTRAKERDAQKRKQALDQYGPIDIDFSNIGPNLNNLKGI